MFTSWKTTLCGAIAAAGVYLTNQGGSWSIVGQVMVALGTFLTGLFARDNAKTSESVGAKQPSGR